MEKKYVLITSDEIVDIYAQKLQDFNFSDGENGLFTEPGQAQRLFFVYWKDKTQNI